MRIKIGVNVCARLVPQMIALGYRPRVLMHLAQAPYPQLQIAMVD